MERAAQHPPSRLGGTHTCMRHVSEGPTYHAREQEGTRAVDINLVIRPKVFQTLLVGAHQGLGFDTCSGQGQALHQVILP